MDYIHRFLKRPADHQLIITAAACFVALDVFYYKTSVFYQAMPAVGADGKNIMKLIPVKRVNRQFYQTETPQGGVAIYDHVSPVPMANKSDMTPPNNHQFIRKQVPAANASSNQIHPAHRAERLPQQLGVVNSTARVPRSVFASPGHQLPVAVQSPVLSGGQFLKTPSDTQVQRVPSSELSPVIKNQIFMSSTSSASPTVVYVSPVTTVDPGASGPPKLPLNTKARGSLTPTGAKPRLKLVPKFSDRPSSPIRWVIEGAEPLQSLQPHRPAENAPLVFDGRVFFVAKRNGSSLKSTAAGQTPVPPSPDPAMPPMSRDRRAPSSPQDVIDLCGDDDNAQRDSTLQALPSRQDEDNVIFVSYVPPKPNSVQTVPPEAPAQRDGGQHSVPDPQLDTATGSPAGPSGREASAWTAQKPELPAPSWTSSAAPEPGQRSDPQLRKMFGITAEVRIYLQQVDRAAAAGFVSAQSPQDRCGPAGPPGLSKPNPPSPRHSSEAQAVIGYMEPIDEDISEESEAQSKPKTKSTHPETQTCVDASPDARRVGRTRKRTLCPCCVPVALHPAVKLGLRLEELEGWTLVQEQTVRRAGRTKASRKDGRTSAKVRYKNCTIHEDPGGRVLSSTPADSFKTSSG